MINRRTFLLWVIASSFPAITFSTLAQVAQLPRVVVISGGNEEGSRPFTHNFLDGMRQAGQIEGRTVQIEVRYGNGDPTRVRALIRESVAKSPAVLVVGGLIAARYARDTTTTVPIVVATSSDLVDAGIVRSLARPGGNITGISDLTDETTIKRLELLKAALSERVASGVSRQPGVSRHAQDRGARADCRSETAFPDNVALREGSRLACAGTGFSRKGSLPTHWSSPKRWPWSMRRN